MHGGQHKQTLCAGACWVRMRYEVINKVVLEVEINSIAEPACKFRNFVKLLYNNDHDNELG